MRILLVSSVAPTATGGGQLLLHRHLVAQPGLDLTLVLEQSWSGQEPSLQARPNRFWSRLRATRFTQSIQNVQETLRAEFAVGPMLAFAESLRPEIVLTVAHGGLASHAQKIAAHLRVPLAAIFHDWWPDLAPERWLRDHDAEFRELYSASRVAFCVSDRMRQELGPHPNAPLLLPIPGPGIATRGSNRPPGKFRVVYTGSLNAVYRDGMEQLTTRLRDHPRLQLELWGDAGEWPAARRDALQQAGTYRGATHSDDPAFVASLAAADALLTHLSFAPADARRVRTSFPSKLTDYTRWGKPLVVWGPRYSSADEWLRPRDAALLVDSPDAATVIRALESLADAPARQQQLGVRAADLYRADFAPANLQRVFRDGLERTLTLSK